MRTIEWARLLAACLVAGSIAFGCDGSPTAQELGSETHFLTVCSESCGAEFSCVCGACTRTCSEAAECRSLSSVARCTPADPRVADGTCSAGESAFCDVGCTVDADCRAVGAAHRCVGGYCREPAPKPGVCVRGDEAAAGAVVIGDALIELSSFLSQLNEAGRAAGVFAPDAGFRGYASSLNSLLGTDTLTIASQYDSARADGPVTLVVMNGGETDALQLTCGETPTSSCPALVAAADGASRLFATMAAGGVRELVYLYYAEPFEQPAIAAELSALRPLLRAACEGSALACHFVDLRPVFEGHESEYYADDGLVWNDAGAGAAARAAFELMQRLCLDW